jgi:hypothetical protein
MALAFQIGRLRAVRVGHYLWYQAGLKRRRSRLSAPCSDIAWEFGGSQVEALRGLRDLEARGLATVQWRPRHPSLVNLPTDAAIHRLLEEQAARAEAHDGDTARITHHRQHDKRPEST